MITGIGAHDNNDDTSNREGDDATAAAAATAAATATATEATAAATALAAANHVSSDNDALSVAAVFSAPAFSAATDKVGQ